MTAVDLAELRPAASGARLTGDDVQHAVAWHAALRTQVPQSGVVAVTVEAHGKGNVDDVVVGMANRPDDLIQVKAAVSAVEPASIAWLTEVSPRAKRGKSILQRFYEVFKQSDAHTPRPTIMLVTNKSIDPKDPVLHHRDSLDRVANRLWADPSTSAKLARDQLTSHLACDDTDLFEFLSHLQLNTDASEAAWRRNIEILSWAAGVRADENAFRLGISEVREWVKRDRTAKSKDDIHQVLVQRGLLAEDPFALLAIAALDDNPGLQDPAITLNWVPYFRGTEPRNRRGLHDPRNWNTALWPDLQRAQARMRSIGTRRILITGAMRLPTWFAAGVTFQETAGFTVGKVKDGTELWAKPREAVRAAEIVVEPGLGALQQGKDVALVLAMSHDLVPDVKRYLASAGLDAQLIVATLPGGPANDNFTGPAHGYAVALAVRNLAREINVLQPPVLHMFMATPAAFAVTLGGVWDRVPNTQLYEDLGVTYEPAFLIPN